jgi:hypothetical protein
VTNRETGEALDKHDLGPVWPETWRRIREEDYPRTDANVPTVRECTPCPEARDIDDPTGFWDPLHEVEGMGDVPEPPPRNPFGA